MIGDLHINRLGFGAMRLTGKGIWGLPENPGNAIDVLKRAIELDVNFIDTADAYGPEVSENLIRQALHPYEGIIIATKGGLTRSGPNQWQADCSPQHLRQAAEMSLKRLAIERIDVYQLHTVDPRVPFEESFQTLLDLQKEGKIRYIGLSNIKQEQYKIARSMGRIVSVQNNYNLFNREHDDIVRLCEKDNIAFIPYFPMAGSNQTTLATDTIVSKIAQLHHASVYQIALAWLLQRSPIMLPIPGTSSVKHLEENMAASNIKLTDQDLQLLDSIEL